MSEIIRKINGFDTFIVRHQVLRAGKSLESCRFEGDDLATTTHFGLFSNENLVGVVSVFENKLKMFAENRQYQIRGMAVLPTEQGRGFGEKLLSYAENYVKTQHGDLIWFNARSLAVKFYMKSGYVVSGDAFEIPDVGTHYIMSKKLH